MQLVKPSVVRIWVWVMLQQHFWCLDPHHDTMAVRWDTNKQYAFLANGDTMGTIPPEFFMWKTTPAPPTPPGPNPQLLWVEQTAPPAPTTAPSWDQCYGCDCVVAFPGDLLDGGNIANKFTCIGGAPTQSVPSFKWAGVPQNSGVGHPLTQKDGSSCIKSMSYAVVMEDLDYPNGVGESTNHVRTLFWSLNIPGDWTEINEQLAHMKYRDRPLVVIGRNDGGTIGMETPCPKKGLHRYRITLWTLKAMLGTEMDPINPDTDYQSTILPMLEANELARTMFYGNVKAPGWSKESFLQRVEHGFEDWFQR